MIGQHIIFGTYGFWLPNDPRGSWSDFVGSYETLSQSRSRHQNNEHRSLAYDKHNQQARIEAKEVLKREPVLFDEGQRAIVAEGFSRSAYKGNVKVIACAIMPDHVHFVLGPHRLGGDKLAGFMKAEATKALVAAKVHPFLAEMEEDGSVPHCWVRGEWKVYIDTLEQMLATIQYVENNPLKEGLPAQTWDFVTRYVPG